MTTSLLQNVIVPGSEDAKVVCKYVEALARKDFSRAEEFFSEDIFFNGLILKKQGRDGVAAEVEQFLHAAIEDIRVEAIAEVESGDKRSRALVLYRFKLKGWRNYEALADHVTLRDRRIVRIDNVFDVQKVQPGA
jgi:hypothetical protein